MMNFIFMSSDSILPFILDAFFLLGSQYEKGYRLTFFSLIFISLLLIGVIGGVFWLVWKDFKRKKQKTGFEILIGKEAEVVEVSPLQNKGWVIYEGENWKFFSFDKLTVGDIVTVLSCKRMVLRVKKIKENL